jgi:hypothetical protein
MRTLLLSSILLAAACATTESTYDEAWGQDDIPSGKADGILDSAPTLAFGTPRTGFVDDGNLDVFAMSLKLGDRFTLVEKVTSGDLSPHFTLYYGASSYVSSASWSRSGATLTKTYVAAQTGTYYIGVKPYQNVGEGNYELRATCTGGPCAGEPVVVPMDADLRAECIAAARECAFEALPAYDGAVGPARARSVFQTCITTVTGDDGEACGEACDASDDDSARALCDDIIGALPFYADQDGDCVDVVASCLDDCDGAASGADENAEEVWETSIGMCWNNGYNGACDSYARAHEACGGDNEADSPEDCIAHCESTEGAWIDDLDTICEEACE